MAVLGTVCAQAGVTTIINQPAAEGSGHLEGFASYTLFGYERHVDSRYYHLKGVNIGLFDRFELAAESDLLGWDTWSFKAMLYEQPELGGYAIAAGFRSIRGRDSIPYLTARWDGTGYRLHAGWTRCTASRGFFAVDAPLGPGTFAVEHTTGPGAATWLGWVGPSPVKDLCWGFYMGVPADRREGVQHYLWLSFGFGF